MPDTPHIWILNYWGGTRTLYLSITHSNSSTSPFLKQQMAPYANPNYANGCFARFQKVFCGVLKCIVTFLWNHMKFQKQFVTLSALKPDIKSPSWVWMAYPAHLLPCSVCSFSANLSKWIRVELDHYFLMASIVFPQPQMVKGFIHKLWAIPGSNEYSHAWVLVLGVWFPVTKAPIPLALVLVERVPWVPVLQHGRLSIYVMAISIRDETSSNGDLRCFAVPPFYSQACMEKVWQIWICCLTFSLECQFPQVGP